MQTEHNKPLQIAAGQDSLQEIGIYNEQWLFVITVHWLTFNMTSLAKHYLSNKQPSDSYVWH